MLMLRTEKYITYQRGRSRRIHHNGWRIERRSSCRSRSCPPCCQTVYPPRTLCTCCRGSRPRASAYPCTTDPAKRNPDNRGGAHALLARLSSEHNGPSRNKIDAEELISKLASASKIDALSAREFRDISFFFSFSQFLSRYLRN